MCVCERCSPFTPKNKSELYRSTTAASLAAEVAQGAVRIQTGRVANYAFVMIAGLAVFVSLIAFGAAR